MGMEVDVVPLSRLPDVKIVYAKNPHVDHRGLFFEMTRSKEMHGAFLRDGTDFVQTNFSQSVKGVLRGLHYQTKNPQGKLMRTVHGQTFNVAVDMRKGSPTFGVSVSALLAAPTAALWVPPGFANGFYSITDSIVVYLCDSYHLPGFDSGVRWNDPALGIAWPTNDHHDIVMTDKDQRLPLLADAKLVPFAETMP